MEAFDHWDASHLHRDVVHTFALAHIAKAADTRYD